MRKMMASLFASALLFAGLAGSASAQVEQDGLVNVNIGDVTILEDVQVAVAANIVAAVCAQDINLALLAVQAVDEGGQDVVCQARGGRPVFRITQNI
jgi:hypothetical protein